jgi:hypothetical protein
VGGVGGDALGGVHGDGVAVGDVFANVIGVEDADRVVAEGRAAMRLFSGLMAVTRQRWPLRTGISWAAGSLVLRSSMVGSLRRVMKRSPTPTRCPRAAVTVCACASMASWCSRWLSASAISVVSQISSASLPAPVSAR